MVELNDVHMLFVKSISRMSKERNYFTNTELRKHCSSDYIFRALSRRRI